MTEKEKELLLSWIMNEEARLDDEYVTFRNNIRFRKVDISDCVELALLMQRRADFAEFSAVLLRLLNFH